MTAVINLHPGADAKAVARDLGRLGLWVKLTDGDQLLVLEHSARVAANVLRDVPGVLSIATTRSEHPRIDAHADHVVVAGVRIGGGAPPVLMAGPCAVESAEQIARLARAVAAAGASFLRGGAYKPRTSPYAFAGHGREALGWLRRAADASGLGVVTELLSEPDATAVAELADLVQIGSRNMQNFALLRAAGRTGRPILLKRGVAATVEEWLLAAEHALHHGAAGVVLCERGVRGFDPSTRNLLDLGAVALLSGVLHLPVIVDPSHSAGRRDLVAPLARAALAAGAAGLLVEVHERPGDALCDGPQALLPSALPSLLAGTIHGATEHDGRDASSRRSDEGVGRRPTTEQRRTDAPQIGHQATENHGLSRLGPMNGTSRLPGFYRDPLPERRHRLAGVQPLCAETVDHLERGGGLDLETADRMSENVIACHGLPLSVGLNFLVNGRDVLVPMAVEEPSVVAAASNAARLTRDSGGFTGEATAPVMTAQIQLDEVADPAGAPARVAAARARILAAGDAAIPSMVARGGGCRDLETRILDDGMVVVHLYVDVGDAMGANLADAVAEGAAAEVRAAVGGRMGLRILSNLPVHRLVRVRTHVTDEAIGGPELAAGIARASRFAELDVYRAVTHNKGVMNGVDAVAVALGQDWRALEAGAHAFASLSGRYRPLAVWRRSAGGLDGVLEMPLAAATAGGSTRAHPGIRAAFDLIAVSGAAELAVVMGAVGLASNLAALRALAGEGIQRGHMKLHERKRSLP